MALASGKAGFGQAKGSVLEIFDDKVRDSIEADLAGNYERDIGLQALETVARNWLSCVWHSWTSCW